jgi:5'-3' exonuclease
MKTLIIDGNYFAYRSAFKMAHLRTSTGIPSGGIFGFMKMLSSIIKEGYMDVIVVFDSAKSERRLALYPNYKKKDEPIEGQVMDSVGETIAYTLRFTKMVLEAMGIRVVILPGMEGDDIIFNIVRTIGFDKCVVCTDDEDFLQFATYGTDIYRHMHEEYVTKDNFRQYMGFDPEYFLIYKAFVGDSSDNIPQVLKGPVEYRGQIIKQGAGAAFAKKYINMMKEPKLSSLANVLIAASDKDMKAAAIVDPEYPFWSTLELNMELVDMSKESVNQELLNTLLTQPVTYNQPLVFQLFSKFEFNSLGQLISQLQQIHMK